MPHLRPLLPQPRPRARTSRARAHLLARVRGTTQGGGRQGGGVDRGTRAAGRPFFYFFDVVVERRKMRARERGAIDVVKEAKKSLFLPRRNPLSPPSLEGPPLRKSTMQSSVALRAGSQIRPARSSSSSSVAEAAAATPLLPELRWSSVPSLDLLRHLLRRLRQGAPRSPNPRGECSRAVD